MAGLLGKITGGLESLLGNPLVQGAGAAAASNLNPLIGLLAGPIIKEDRERRELENEKSRELLAGSKSRREAADEFAQLLSTTRGREFPSLGLLGVEGLPSPGTVGGFTQESVQVPSLSTQSGQQEGLGLLLQAAPAATAQQLAAGILGPQGGTPSRVSERMRIGQELGLSGDELVKFAGGSSGSGNDILDQILKGLQIQNENADIIERNREIQEAADARAEEVNRLNSAGGSILALEKRIDSLDGTGVLGNPLDLETAFGVASVLPESLVRGATGLVGEQMSKEDIANLRDQQQEFNIFANDVLVNTAGDLTAIGRTDAGRALLAGTKPSASLSGQPNIAASALAAQRVLDSDPDGQMDPGVRSSLEALIRRAETGSAERQQDIADAQQALADGAPVEDVRRLLIDNGIDPAELGL